MTSPEQQPVSQPEKNPADPGFDIDAAKKFLEEAYGPEKSSIQVYGPEKQEVKEKEAEEKSIAPKVIEKNTEANESQKNPITTEELTERIKKEKETQDARIEAAKNELIDLAKSIKEAKERKTKTEYLLYGWPKEVFETATGENLEKITREKAKIEAESEGFKVITPEEYRKEKTTETQERIRQKERSAIIKERWDMLSVKEKEKYFSGEEDRNDTTAISSARNKFAVELNRKISEKITELSRGKKSISISEDVFYELMKKGLKSEDIRRTGFWDWFKDKGEIKISPLDKTDKRGPLIKTKEYLAEMEVRVKKHIEEAGKEEIERKIIEGQKMWRAKKQRHAGEIIQETVIKYETEKKLKVKPETAQKSKIEIVSRIGRERTPEQMREMEKIRKQVEADIKKSKETKKRIEELIRRQKKGELLTTREVAYLRAVEFSQKTEKELKGAV
ncbi:MAG: hypothetical protein AAB529_00735 [Patescibacteria group bacterium]